MATPPNILVIMTDQHSPQVAGFAGDPVVKTQHLDALASRSVQFAAASCASPICTPSRMTMLAGKEPHNCAAWQNHWVIFPEHVTWPEHFANHGYRTCLVGKMHFGGRDQMQGFQARPYGDLKHGLGHQPEPIDMFPGYGNVESAGACEIPESLLQDVVVSRETLGFIREHASATPHQPWFVCASFGRPHAPLTSPARYLRRYKDQPPTPVAFDRSSDSYEPFAALCHDRQGAKGVTAEQMKFGREAYYAAVDFVDDCIGEVLEGLERDGLLDNTIVIYTSDHGEMAGAHGLWGKMVYFEQSIGVPLLISGPGVKRGHHTVDQPISLIDLFPTTCGLAGLPVPEGLDGVDWSQALAQPDADIPPPREHAFSAYYTYATRVKHLAPVADDEQAVAMRVARGRRWKYIDVEGARPVLFDLENDPHELTNLAREPEHHDRCAAMQALLDDQITWAQIHERLEADRERLPAFASGVKPTTPNQYMLPDGRLFDAEESLYNARWLPIPPGCTGGIIPQQFG